MSAIILRDPPKPASSLPAVFPRPLVVNWIKEVGPPKNPKFLKLFKDEIKPFLDEHRSSPITSSETWEARKLDMHVLKTGVPSINLCYKLLTVWADTNEKAVRWHEALVADFEKNQNRSEPDSGIVANKPFQTLRADSFEARNRLTPLYHLILKQAGHVFNHQLGGSESYLFSASHKVSVSYRGKTYPILLLDGPDADRFTIASASMNNCLIYVLPQIAHQDFYLSPAFFKWITDYSPASNQKAMRLISNVSGFGPGGFAQTCIHEIRHLFNFGYSTARFISEDSGISTQHSSIYSLPTRNIYYDYTLEEATAFLSEMVDGPNLKLWLKSHGEWFSKPSEDKMHYPADQLVFRMVHFYLKEKQLCEVSQRAHEDMAGIVGDVRQAAESSELAVRWAAHHAMRDLYHTNYRITDSDTF